jgi:carbon storage regulator
VPRPPETTNRELPACKVVPGVLKFSASLGAGGSNGRETPMLVLTRKSNQSIMIGDEIEVSVLSIMGEKVRIGIDAPRSVPVFRKEVYVEIQQDRSEDRRKVGDALERLKNG